MKVEIDDLLRWLDAKARDYAAQAREQEAKTGRQSQEVRKLVNRVRTVQAIDEAIRAAVDEIRSQK
ncbi:MAG: hypothetical protein AB7F96_15445 [Beijerinckiaceae bacterium]